MQNSIHFDEVFFQSSIKVCVAECEGCVFFTWFTQQHFASVSVCFGAGCSYCGLTSPAPDSAGLQSCEAGVLRTPR